MAFHHTRTFVIVSLSVSLSALTVGAASHAALPSITNVTSFTAALPTGGNGSRPSNPLTEAADGYLYSRARSGGGTVVNNTQGGTDAVFFRIKNDGTGFDVLASGPGTVAPTSTRWIGASDGYLYSPGPASGLLQRYRHGTTTGWEDFFTGTSGFITSITQADGLFYLTNNTGSALTSLSADGKTETLLRATGSSAATDGSSPHYMLRASDGRLYGLHTSGGSSFSGTLFSMARDGSDYRVLLNFASSTTGYQNSNAIQPLIEASDGKLYGINYNGSGGDVAGGAIYRIDKDGSNYEMIYSFATNTDRGGYNPNTIFQAKDGHIYISTVNGGATGGGTILRYRIDDGVLELLYTFEALTGPPQNNVWTNPNTGATAVINSVLNGGSNAAGRTPQHLMQASNGQFYGVAMRGGSHGWGSLFRFEPGDEVAPDAMLNDVPPELLGFGVEAGYTKSATVAVGRSINLYWDAKAVAGCTATSNEPGSAWTGNKLAKANTSTTAVAVAPVQAGTWTYTLTCRPQSASYDPVSAFVMVNAAPAVTETESVGNGGGGALAWALAPLAWLGMARRRSRGVAAPGRASS